MIKINKLQEVQNKLGYGKYPMDIVASALMFTYIIETCFDDGTSPIDSNLWIMTESDEDFCRAIAEYKLEDKTAECEFIIHEDNSCIWCEITYILDDVGRGITLVRREEKHGICI